MMFQIITGATGSVGAHVLHALLQDDSVSTVFCLTRQKSPMKAIFDSLKERRLFLTRVQASRIQALCSTMDQPDLGLSKETIEHIRECATEIIHAAWPVNFNLPLVQFVSHIRGVHNLVQLSLSVRQPKPAVMLFCSSISTALASPSTFIADQPLNLRDAYMGYGRSKLIGEHIVSNARRSGARCYSLRIGQVSGHSRMGLWNDSEAIPLMVRSALTLKALPDLDHTCSWLPVDKLASIIVEISQTCSSKTEYVVTEQRDPIPYKGEHWAHGADSGGSAVTDDSIYNICNPRDFSWSAFLNSLKRNGFQFNTVPFEDWMKMLRQSEACGEEHINPAVKLIDHYEEMYGNSSILRSKHFHTTKAEKDSVTMRKGQLLTLENGILNNYARDWLNRWMAPESK